MCTVTFIAKKKGHYFLTSNRDEAPKRSATDIVEIVQDDKKIAFPQDPQAKGTWIATSNTNQIVCLLNGAFEKHKRQPPYRMSRGLMVLQFFKYSNANHFFDEFDFKEIEPFTMIIFDNGNLYEFRWDEKQRHIKQLNPEEKHIWSSCTLYPPNWQSKRITWFENWQKELTDINQDAILGFHKNSGEGNSDYDIVMNRNDIVRTVSITSILMSPNETAILHKDLLDENKKQHKLKSITDFIKKERRE